MDKNKLENILSGGYFRFKRIFTFVYGILLILSVVTVVVLVEIKAEMWGIVPLICFCVIIFCLVAILVTRKWRPRVGNTANSVKALEKSGHLKDALTQIAPYGEVKNGFRVTSKYLFYVEKGVAVKLENVINVTIRHIWRPVSKKYLPAAFQCTLRLNDSKVVSFRYPTGGVSVETFLKNVSEAAPNAKIVEN